MGIITAKKFHEALVEAGILRPGDRVRRVVIDAMVGHVVVVHVEQFGDDRFLQVARTLDGVVVEQSGIRCASVDDREKDRIVRCHLMDGHDGEHTDSDTGSTW
jgi:hypothetical protein